MTLLALLVLALVFALCVFLVFSPDYRTGAVGALGLMLMGVAIGLRFVQELHGEVLISPMTLLLLAGNALFLSQHVCRVIRHARPGAMQTTQRRRLHVAP